MLDIAFTVNAPRWKKILAADKPFFTRVLNAACEALELPDTNFAVSLVFTDDAEIQELNRDYRSKDKPTNVLSFPLIEDFSTLPEEIDEHELGDIIFAYETVQREAQEQNKSFRDHVAHLLVHGMLHLFGYDHMTKREEKEMEAIEIDVLQGLGIANPYFHH